MDNLILLILGLFISVLGITNIKGNISTIHSYNRRKVYEFDIPFSRQQLADYLGVERSGLSLELGKMRNEGLLDFHKSHFILKV